MKDKNVRFLTFTAMGIALVILAQFLGNFLPAGFTVVGPFTGKQLVTGSLVNCVLYVFTGAVGILSGVVIGLLSSLLAFFFGIGPILPVVPVVACGNALLCLVFGLLRKSGKLPAVVDVILSALLKCGFLWLLVPMVARAAGVPFAAAGWANDIPKIEAFMRKNCDRYFKTVAALKSYLFED